MKNTHDRQYDLYIMDARPFYTSVGQVRQHRRYLNRTWARRRGKGAICNNIRAYCDYVERYGYLTGEST